MLLTAKFVYWKQDEMWLGYFRELRADPASDAFAVAIAPATSACGSALWWRFALSVLTASRSGEARGATWDEIDVEAKAWTIAAEDEGEDGAPGAAVAALPGSPRRGAGPPRRARPAILSSRASGAADSPTGPSVISARLRRRSRAARLPQQFSGLGVGMHGRAARRDGGGARARRAEPGRGGLREERPVRPAAQADGRMGRLHLVSLGVGVRGENR